MWQKSDWPRVIPPFQNISIPSLLRPVIVRTVNMRTASSLISTSSTNLISKFQSAALIGGRLLKEGSTYFKGRGNFMKFQNFVIFFFQISINNYHYEHCFKYSRTTSYFHFVYLFYMNFNLVAVIARKMKFSIKDFFSKCDQICRFLRIW